MTDETKLGATGRFPDGKLHPGDEGELRFAIGKGPEGNVNIYFNKDVAWLSMPPADAIKLAEALLRHAGAKDATP